MDGEENKEEVEELKEVEEKKEEVEGEKECSGASVRFPSPHCQSNVQVSACDWLVHVVHHQYLNRSRPIVSAPALFQTHPVL